MILETIAADGYVIRPEALMGCLQKHPKVKAIILCNPSNPTGCVSDKVALEKVAAVIEGFPRVLVLADEIYEQLTYDVPHVSFASLPGMFDRSVHMYFPCLKSFTIDYIYKLHWNRSRLT